MQSSLSGLWVAFLVVSSMHAPPINSTLSWISTVTFIAAIVLQIHSGRVWISKLIWSLPAFKHRTILQLSVFWLFSRLLLGRQQTGPPKAVVCVVRVIYVIAVFAIDLYSRLCFLAVEGAQSYTHTSQFTERTMVAGVLLLLTVYKLLSYRDQFNRTWAPLFSVRTGWSFIYLLFRIIVLARDSIAYFLVVSGL
jgi:hypothetical protein